MRPGGADADDPAPLQVQCGVDQVRPVFAGGAVAAEPGVDLQVDHGGTVRGRRGDRVELPAGGDAELDVVLDGGAPIGVLTVQPGEEGSGDTGAAQDESGWDLEHGEGGGSRLQPGLGDGEQAVPVGVGLDGEHDLRRRGDRGETGDVASQGGEVDDGARQRLGDGVDDRHALCTLSMRRPSRLVMTGAATPIASAQSSTVGSPRAGSPNRTTGSPGEAAPSPMSTTN